MLKYKDFEWHAKKKMMFEVEQILPLLHVNMASILFQLFNIIFSCNFLLFHSLNRQIYILKGSKLYKLGNNTKTK